MSPNVMTMVILGGEEALSSPKGGRQKKTRSNWREDFPQHHIASGNGFIVSCADICVGKCKKDSATQKYASGNVKTYLATHNYASGNVKEKKNIKTLDWGRSLSQSSMH